jgi:putative ABC transport system ATP-binding protein
MPQSDSALEATGLWLTYGRDETRVTAVRGVDLTVARGEFVAVVGPSGSGKSTLLHLLGTLERPDAGTVRIEGRDVSELQDAELALLRRRRLGFVLQFFNLLPTLSAAENAAFPLLIDGDRRALARARESLRGVGLEHRAAHRPAQLSGGEQQRVALARALVTEPAAILADEPTGNLDRAAATQLLEQFRRSADGGQTIVMVTHDEHVGAYADRVLEMADGQLSGGEGAERTSGGDRARSASS